MEGYSTLLHFVCGLLASFLLSFPTPNPPECQLSSLNGSLKAFGIPSRPRRDWFTIFRQWDEPTHPTTGVTHREREDVDEE